MEQSKPVRWVGPPALVAASAHDTKETNALVLLPQHLEFLAVRVSFHGAGVSALKVSFRTTDGSEVVQGLMTDAHGQASAPRRVPAGSYVCEIEDQATTLVCTVPTLSRRFPVVLPLGRPYGDVNERLEFQSGAPAGPTAVARGGRR